MFKILVSEHADPSFQQVTELLKKQGFELEQINDGEDFSERMLEKSRTDKPDLILLPPDLPENLGFKLCKSLKNNPQTESIPVVFIHCEEAEETNSHGENGKLLVEGLESGAHDYIHDPSRVDELLARIHAAIRTKMSISKSKALAEQLNQMNSELYERNLAVEKELYTTRQLQQSLLPPFLPEDPITNGQAQAAALAEQPKFSKCHFRDDKLRISGVYLPCDALGGDIYDVIRFHDQSVGVAIADVSGHGVPAAFVTAIFKASFYRTTHNFSKPGEILYHLNNELINIIKTGQYVTGVYCRIFDSPDGRGQKMQFSGAGHPYPFYYQAKTGKMMRLEENGTPLAWFKDMDYPMGEISLMSGDKILMFTDGISEMKNIHGAMYGEEALGKLFQDLVDSNDPQVLDTLLKHLSDFTEGHPLDDDVSVVLIEAL